METYRQGSTTTVPSGDVLVKMLFEANQNQPGTGGTATLWTNGEKIGEGRMPRTVPVAFSTYAGMDIGRDNGLVVDLDYEDKTPTPSPASSSRSSSTSSPPPWRTRRSSTGTGHGTTHAVAHGIHA